MGVISRPVGKLFGTRARATATIAALTALVVAGVSVVYGSIPDSAGIIHACYKINGQLRLIDPGTSNCDPSETLLAWNQTGPQGPVGPQGPPGPQSELTAFGGSLDLGDNEGVANDPNADAGTVGRLLLPAGKYAIFAKINIKFDELNSDIEQAVCSLIAGDDFDSGFRSSINAGGNTMGVISLMTLHEFAADGYAEMACWDFGHDDLADMADASWSELRITAIKLGSLQVGPLLH